MLAKVFDKERNWGNAVDKDGNCLIDRSPEYFEPLLNYLWNGVLILNKGVNLKGVLEEAKFFGLKQSVEELEATVKLNEKVDSCIDSYRVYGNINSNINKSYTEMSDCQLIWSRFIIPGFTHYKI